ncbi:MAG: 5-carboxymethyl-2-hydroxymuconate Delta-isomerase [Burkholderiales bacterium]|nr:5-carboxymethyl-2-hydroxymuconate Delta-isomerase [Burkholderiales bacterium]
MPHIVIEYSANIRDRIALPALIDKLHETAIRTGVFPLGGTRTRAAERTHYKIADGHPDNGFVHVSMMIGAGREPEVKHNAARAVFDALVEHTAPLFAQAPLGLTLEVRELEPELSFKHNNLHDYVKARQAGKEKP